MEASPVGGYPGDEQHHHHRTRATPTGTTRANRVDAPGGYPGDAQDHLRARRAAPSSGRMEVGAAAAAAAAVARGSAGALSEAQSARRRNHTKSIGHYILGKTIGEGTFGKVKLGTHILTGEKVAVKVLEKERIIDVADVERVAREVYILKLIRHQNVVQLYEIIETSRQLYLIMEYASGGELFDFIVASGRILEPEACRFFRQIVEGVEEIHKMNVVHRDLKPENLLLDEHCDIKIVDFGLSNTYRDGQLLKTACGSPCYAAPEMIAGKEYVPSLCDIWSCGVILFAMLCGYLPFEDQNTAALYRKILAAEYTLPDFLSPGARDLISGMLTTDPTRRLTAAGLRQQPWFCQAAPAEENISRNRGGELRYFEEDILEELEKFGFPPDYTQRCLRMNKHNHVTTTYHLLERKKQRMMDQVMLDQLPQDSPFNAGAGVGGVEQVPDAGQGGSVRVGGHDGSDFRVDGQDYSNPPNSARGVNQAAPMDGSSSARGATSQPRSPYTGAPQSARGPNSTPPHGASPAIQAWQPQAGAQVRDPRVPGGNVYLPPDAGGPPSPRTSARGPGSVSGGSVPPQPRVQARPTVAPSGPVASPVPGHQQYRSESPVGAAAHAAALAQGGSAAAPSRRPRSEITTPRGVRRPSQDRLPGGRSPTDGYPDRDRPERDRSAMEERPGPGTPGASAGGYPASGDQGPRSARTSFGANGGPAPNGGVSASASGTGRATPTGIGSPGTGAGGRSSGRMPSPPRFSNKNPAVPGQQPSSARPLTTPSHATAAPSSARGSFPPSSSRGGSHSLSTRAAYSMSARSQTPPATQLPGGDSRNQTPSRSSTTSARGPPSNPRTGSTPAQTPPEPQQQPQQPQPQLQAPQPRTPLPTSQTPQQPSTPTQPVPGPAPQQQPLASSQTPPGPPGQPQQQPIPGTPPQVYQQLSGIPAHQPGQQLPGQSPGQQLPGSVGAPPGSTAAALAALRARRPYAGPGEVTTPRSEQNTPRGQTSATVGGVTASSGSQSARGPAPLSGQPGYGASPQHGLPRWPGAGAAEPGRAPVPGERPVTAERPQQPPDRAFSPGDRPLSSRVTRELTPTQDLNAMDTGSFAPLSARDAANAPLSSREAREDRRAALDTLRTSSRPPRLIMQELQRVLGAQRVASKQVSPLTLRCQWLSLKFDVEVAPLDRLGSIHAVRARRTAGEPWQYKDVCNRLLAELRIA